MADGSRHVSDKGLLNSTLDSVRVPTIWITNIPADALDESSRRRFDYSIRFDPLNTEQRLAIWHNNVAKMKLEHLIDDTMLNKFASIYPVSAGGITLTLQNLVKLSPRPDEVESLVKKLMVPHCELLNISQVDDKLLPAKDYSLEGLNIKGNLPLDRIVDAIRYFQQGRDGAIDRPRMNLLLSGAPGTGKTEFVKYLGSVLNTKVVVKGKSVGITALEINISCPNVKAGGAAFGTDVALAAQVVREVRKSTKLPLITKLSPNVTRISDFARAAEAEGSDMVSLINTLGAMAIDIEKRRPVLANRFGGLSGPAVKPVALKMVYETSRAVKIPVIGMGGIMCGADAVEFLLAGAKAVAVGTANFVEPTTPLEIIDFIGKYMDRHGFKTIEQLSGALEE